MGYSGKETFAMIKKQRALLTLFSNIIFLLITWKFHIMCPNHIHFPALPGSSLPPPAACELLQNKRRKREENNKSNLC